MNSSRLASFQILGAVSELSLDFWISLYVIILSVFIGYEVVRRVPLILHTPLMSGSNFIHGIVLVGAIVSLGYANTDLERILGFVAVVMASLNVTGGYAVTDRMLGMFKSSKENKESD